MSIKYRLQKFLGRLLSFPIIPEGKTVGYSLVKSERFETTLGRNSLVASPYFLHHVSLGDYSYISKNSQISHCTIGKFCSIGPNFCCGLGIHPTNGISTSPMFYSTAMQNGVSLCKVDKVQEHAYTFIGNDVFIGANVTILDGIIIGDGAVIGAGAVVTKDVPPYAIVTGVPAMLRRFRFDNETIAELLKKQWWNAPEESLQNIERNFFDVKKYLNSD